MWAAEHTSAFHAGSSNISHTTNTVVVAAGMLLTVPFEIGFGRETLGERFLIMLPGKDGMEGTGMRLGRSLAPVTNLVKRLLGLEDGNDEAKNGEEGMVID